MSHMMGIYLYQCGNCKEIKTFNYDIGSGQPCGMLYCTGTLNLKLKIEHPQGVT